MKSLLFALTLALPFAARAEMTAITVAASVRAFDTKTVLIQVNKRRVRIPRQLVKESEIREGEAILVTFRGDDIRLLFPESIAKTSTPGARTPASKP